MKNELNWKTGENGSLPMILDEKGLNLKGFSKFMFYLCAGISMLSMFWVIIVSIGAFASANQDPTTPEYYKIIAIASIAIETCSPVVKSISNSRLSGLDETSPANFTKVKELQLCIKMKNLQKVGLFIFLLIILIQ